MEKPHYSLKYFSFSYRFAYPISCTFNLSFSFFFLHFFFFFFLSIHILAFTNYLLVDELGTTKDKKTMHVKTFDIKLTAIGKILDGKS